MENLTGGLGQLGIECAKLLRSRYGSESVILSDIVKPNDEIMENGPYIFCDILDFKVKEKKIGKSCTHTRVDVSKINIFFIS